MKVNIDIINIKFSSKVLFIGKKNSNCLRRINFETSFFTPFINVI